MNNFCWEYFKRTGSIEAYVYMFTSKRAHFEKEMIREIKDHDDGEYGWNSIEIHKI